MKGKREIENRRNRGRERKWETRGGTLAFQRENISGWNPGDFNLANAHKVKWRNLHLDWDMGEPPRVWRKCISFTYNVGFIVGLYMYVYCMFLGDINLLTIPEDW